MPRRSGPSSSRLAVVDLARGLALIAMVVYHFSWDLSYFRYVPWNVSFGPEWKLFARAIATSFLILAGLSLVLARTASWMAYLKRLGLITASALAITGVTFWMMPDRFIFFGILHAIALFSVIGLAFRSAPVWLIAAAAIVSAGLPFVASAELFDARFLEFLGLGTKPPLSNDYVPVFPWFAAYLTGIGLGRWVEARRDRIARIRLGTGRIGGGIGTAGRHTLAIYLIHQPVLMGLLYGLTFVLPQPAATPGPETVAAYLDTCRRSCQSGGGEAGFCARHCSCTADSIIDAGLWGPAGTGTMTDAQRARFRVLIATCRAASADTPQNLLPFSAPPAPSRDAP
ncbi:heparan-alpha-glucosaminide N-acetyltransferase [Segnochrobactraceae bacterium EtOH-i3]